MAQFLNSYYSPYQQRLQAEHYEANREPLSGGEVLEGIGSAFSQFNTVGATLRTADRIKEANDLEFDEDYELSDEDFAQLSLQYDKDEIDYLGKANSKEERLARERYIKEDRESFQQVRKLGATGGFAATMAAGILDPLAIATGTLTGGLGTAATTARFASKAKTFAMSASAVAVEGALTEAYLQANSSQRDEYNILTAAAGGALFGGTLGLVHRNSKFKQVAEVERIDAEIAAEAARRAERISSEARAAVNTVNVEFDKVSINRWKAEAITEVQQKSRGATLDDAQRAKLETDINTKVSSLEADRARLKSIEADAPPQKVSKLKRVVNETTKDVLNPTQRRAITKEIADRTANPKWRGSQFKDVTTPALNKALSKSEKAVRVKGFYTKAMSAERLRSRIATSEATLEELNLRKNSAVEAIDTNAEVKAIRGLSEDEVLARIKEKNPNFVPYKIVEQVETAKANAKEAQAKFTKSQADAVEGEETLTNAEAKTADKVVKLAEEGNKFVNDYVDLRKFGPLAPVANRLIHSMSAPLRGLSRVAFDFGQGGSNARTVDSSILIHRAKMEANLGGTFQYGFDLWKKENGYSRTQGIFNGKVEAEYHKQVIKQISNPKDNVPESIKVAAEGWKRMTDYAWKTAVDAGEAGFEEGKSLENYFTTLVNDKAIASYVNDARVGRAAVEGLLSESYQRGAHKFTSKQADLIARYVVDGQLAKYHTGSGSTTRNVLVDAEQVRKLLGENGLRDDVIEDFITSINEDLSAASMSNRAKASLGADLSVETILPNGDRFSMTDLIENDISKVANGYMNERAAGISWAQAGFKSRHELNDFINEASKLGVKDYPENSKQILQEVEVMRQAVAAQYGEILPDDLKGAARTASRRVRQFSSLMVGQRLGLSAMPDLYRAMVNHGLKNTITASKELNLFTNPDFAKALTTGNAWKNPMWKELNLMVGYSGFDDKLQALTRSIDFEEGVSDGFGAMIDAGLQKGIRVNGLLSGLRQVQRGIDQLSVRSAYLDISKRLMDNNPTPYHLNMMGWNEATWNRMAEQAKNHAGSVNFEGENFRVLNVEMMEGDAQELIGMAINRVHRRNTTRMSVGEAPLMTNKEYGRFLLMFRQFTIGSVEKQLIHDVRAGGMQTAKLLSGSIGFGLMTYATKTLVDAGKEDDPEAYFRDRMQGNNLTFGVMANVGQAAAFSQLGDFGATLGLIPDDWYSGSNREGFRAVSNLGSISPATAGADKTIRGLSGTISAIIDGDFESGVKSTTNMLPFLNTTAAATGQAVIGNVLD